jgi:hypothetical protein
LLVLWCAGGRCDMTCIDEDRGRSRRFGAEDRGWLHRSGTRWPGGQEVGWRHVLNVLYSLMSILAHGYLLVIMLWSSYVDSHLFCMFWHGDGYNCSNTRLYTL